MEQPPHSSLTTPRTPTFPAIPDPVQMTELEIARHHVTTTRHLTDSLINKLSRIQQRLSSDIGFEREEDDLLATRRWADEVVDAAWEVVRKAGRLVDDVEYLAVRLGDEEENGESSAEADEMQVDVQNEEMEKNSGDSVR
ncbi:hypothetical protein BU25DRAFT_466132 [Macroventuria anomochaeta]|uniref:Uncharacterized protein n=1 Tax=Macroventuria anomochaeta TaxID=301207 RepID=A0ACB6S6S8_9PLEO|nr:uncharacterized protein BU25DRAFT_466132 [Macroventuria anomochaeta]KAF2629069.1 hypothetical protein BU25DRAFT_466132 [Macroventuria anomochaeta]